MSVKIKTRSLYVNKDGEMLPIGMFASGREEKYEEIIEEVSQQNESIEEIDQKVETLKSERLLFDTGKTRSNFTLFSTPTVLGTVDGDYVEKDITSILPKNQIGDVMTEGSTLHISLNGESFTSTGFDSTYKFDVPDGRKFEVQILSSDDGSGTSLYVIFDYESLDGVELTADNAYISYEKKIYSLIGKEIYGDNFIVTRDAAYRTNAGVGCEAKGFSSLAEGSYSKALDEAAHAEGRKTVAEGYGSHSEGGFTTASGVYSHAEGLKSKATGDISHADGQLTEATGDLSHAEGDRTVASGATSHAEGQSTKASGAMSHSGGNRSEASGRCSFSHGNYVNTNKPSQFAVGYGNDPKADSVFEVGNGLNVNGQPNNTGNDAPITRQNAFRVTQSGNAVAQNDVIAKGDSANPISLNDVGTGFYELRSKLEERYPFGITINSIDPIFENVEATFTADKDSDDNELGWYISQAISETNVFEAGERSHNQRYILKINDTSYVMIEDIRAGDLNAGGGWHNIRFVGDCSVFGYTPREPADEIGYCLCNRLHHDTKTHLYSSSSSSVMVSLYKVNADVKRLPYDLLPERLPRTIAGKQAGSMQEYGGTKNDGNMSWQEGTMTMASGVASHAEGSKSTASGDYSHAEGSHTTSSGHFSHAEGVNSTSSGNISHAEGRATTASSYTSHAEGYDTTASSPAAHAEGYGGTASGYYSHAEGWDTIASGTCSHAENVNAEAVGSYTHAEGAYSVANGLVSHVGGVHSEANGDVSFAHGNYVNATGTASFVVGYGNDPKEDSVFEVGNGLNANGEPNFAISIAPITRQNAFRVTRDGKSISQTDVIAESGGKNISLSAVRDDVDEIDYLANGNLYKYTEESADAYSRGISDSAINAKVQSIGGKSVRFAQVLDTSNTSIYIPSSGGTSVALKPSHFDKETNSAIIEVKEEDVDNDASTSAALYFSELKASIIAGHRYAYVGTTNVQIIGSRNYFYLNGWSTEKRTIDDGKLFFTFTATETGTFGNSRFYTYGLKIPAGTEAKFEHLMVFDITDLPDVNSYDDLKAIYPDTLYPYSSPEIVSADVDKVVYNKGSDTREYTIPAEIRALPGYGLSLGSKKNEVNFETGVYTQNVGMVNIADCSVSKTSTDTVTVGYYFRLTLADGLANTNIKCTAYDVEPLKGLSNIVAEQGTDVDKIMFVTAVSNGGVVYFIDSRYTNTTEFKEAMSGQRILYELAAPVETDISEYLTNWKEFPVEDGGTITFHQSSDTVKLPVQSSIKSKVKTDIDKKLTAPGNVAVGKYFRVASIDSEGNPVLEACDLPVAGNTGATAGIAKFYGSAYGIGINSSGVVYPVEPTAAQITGRKSGFPIQCKNIPAVVKSGMCASVSTTDPEWTDAEKLAARTRIGLNKQWELIEEFTLTSDSAFSRSATPDGTPYNFEKAMVIKEYPTGADYSSLTGYGRVRFSNASGAYLNSECSCAKNATAPAWNMSVFDNSNGMAVVDYVRTVNKSNGACAWNRKAYEVGAMYGFGNCTSIWGPSDDTDPVGTVIRIFAIWA